MLIKADQTNSKKAKILLQFMQL